MFILSFGLSGDILYALGISLDFSICVSHYCRPAVLHVLANLVASEIDLVGLVPTEAGAERLPQMCHTSARPAFTNMDIAAV